MQPFNTENPDAPVQVTLRTTPDLPAHVLDQVRWTEYLGHTGYHIQNIVNNLWYPVEFINDHWHWVYNTDGRFFTSLDDRIEPYTEGTGYWRLTDPQHPGYMLEPLASTSTRGLLIYTQPLAGPSPSPELPATSPFVTAASSQHQTRSPSPETSPEDNAPSSESPETLAPTAAPSARLSPQEQTVLAAQFRHVLDIHHR